MAGRRFKTAEEKKREINALTESRNNAVEKYFETPDQLKEYLNFMNQFYSYSVRNSVLIQNQFNGAEAVGSFAFWKEKGFPVQKGEKGIKILAPTTYKTFIREKNNKEVQTPLKYATKEEKEKIKNGEIKTKEHLGYTPAYVFDISQTSATTKDLPDIFPNRWLDGTVENYDQMKLSLETLANNMHVTVLENPLEELGVSKGRYVEYDQRNLSGEMERRKGIELNPRNGQLQDIKTLVHELAHAKLHNSSTDHAKNLNHSEKEFQAELTAYTVCSYFNIDTSDYSLQYLHHYTKDHDQIKDKLQLLEEVKATSHEFITHLEKDLASKAELVDEKSSSRIEQLDKDLQEQYGDIQIIINDEVKQIADLSLEEFQHHFYDKHNRNILSQHDLSNMNKEEVIKAFNNLDSDWSKFNRNIKMIDDTLEEPQSYVVWSETNIKHNLMNIKDMDKELAAKNLDSFLDAGYAKTRINFVVPSDQGISVHPVDRIDLGDGNYRSLNHHLNAQSYLKNYTPENEEHLSEIYSKPALTTKIQNIYLENLHLDNRHNVDSFELDISKMNMQSIEGFSVENNILSKDEITSIKDDVKQKFEDDKEYVDATNKTVNLKGHYEKYQKQLKMENTGELTEEKVVNRMNAENTYNSMKNQALESNVVTKETLSKMEKDVQRKYSKGSQSEQQQTKSTPFDKPLKKQKSTGLSM